MPHRHMARHPASRCPSASRGSSRAAAHCPHEYSARSTGASPPSGPAAPPCCCCCALCHTLARFAAALPGVLGGGAAAGRRCARRRLCSAPHAQQTSDHCCASASAPAGASSASSFPSATSWRMCCTSARLTLATAAASGACSAPAAGDGAPCWSAPGARQRQWCASAASSCTAACRSQAASASWSGGALPLSSSAAAARIRSASRTAPAAAPPGCCPLDKASSSSSSLLLMTDSRLLGCASTLLLLLLPMGWCTMGTVLRHHGQARGPVSSSSPITPASSSSSSSSSALPLLGHGMIALAAEHSTTGERGGRPSSERRRCACGCDDRAPQVHAACVKPWDGCLHAAPKSTTAETFAARRARATHLPRRWHALLGQRCCTLRRADHLPGRLGPAVCAAIAHWIWAAAARAGGPMRLRILLVTRCCSCSRAHLSSSVATTPAYAGATRLCITPPPPGELRLPACCNTPFCSKDQDHRRTLSHALREQAHGDLGLGQVACVKNKLRAHAAIAHPSILALPAPSRRKEGCLRLA